MNSVGLNRAWNRNEILVDHGDKCRVMLLGKVGVNPGKLVNVVSTVVRWEGNSSEQHTDVRRLKAAQHGIEIAARLIERQPAQAIVASKFDNDYDRMEPQDQGKTRHGIFCCCAARPLI